MRKKIYQQTFVTQNHPCLPNMQWMGFKYLVCFVSGCQDNNKGDQKFNSYFIKLFSSLLACVKYQLQSLYQIWSLTFQRERLCQWSHQFASGKKMLLAKLCNWTKKLTLNPVHMGLFMSFVVFLATGGNASSPQSGISLFYLFW